MVPFVGYLTYFLYLLFFKRLSFDINSIRVGKEIVSWNDIEAISTIPVFGFFGGLYGPGSGIVYFDIKTENRKYRTSPVLDRSQFVDVINKTMLFDIAQVDWAKYPVRWKKKGTDYQRTGLLDLLNEQSYVFINNTGTGDKKLFYILIAGVLVIIGVVILFYLTLLPG